MHASPTAATAEQYPIPGFPGHFTDELGNIYGVTGRTLIKRDGGEVVATTSDGRQVRVNAARLVALAHYGPPPDENMGAIHIDGNRGNNHPSNMEWSYVKNPIVKGRKTYRNEEGEPIDAQGYRVVTHKVKRQVKDFYDRGNRDPESLAEWLQIKQATAERLLHRFLQSDGEGLGDPNPEWVASSIKLYEPALAAAIVNYWEASWDLRDIALKCDVSETTVQILAREMKPTRFTLPLWQLYSIVHRIPIPEACAPSDDRIKVTISRGARRAPRLRLPLPPINDHPAYKNRAAAIREHRMLFPQSLLEETSTPPTMGFMPSSDRPIQHKAKSA